MDAKGPRRCGAYPKKKKPHKTDVASTLTGVAMNDVAYLHGLFVRTCNGGFRRACVCAAGENSVQIRPIYRQQTEEMRWLSGSFRSMDAEVTRAHTPPRARPTPPIAYRSNSQQRPTAAASRYGALLGADPRPRPRLIYGN
jgi:hypothetical protein